MSPPIVQARDLTVGFPTRTGVVNAVNGISFDLNRGEILTVIGESGSGKSVMMKTLLGLNPPQAILGGSVKLDGEDITTLNAARISELRGRKVSMIFQDPSSALDPVFTIGDQIVETILRHEDVSRGEAEKRSQELLERVSIPSAARRLKNYPHEMSGGMRQRAMIALALACRPAVLLADEPTTALDATVQIQLLLLLRELQREMDMALIFVTHDMGVAAEISDKVAVMYAGRFVEKGSVEQVLLARRHPYTRGLMDSTVHAGMRGRTLETIPGAPPDLRRLGPGCAFAPRCRFARSACHASLPSREAVAEGQEVACFRWAELDLAAADA